MVGTTISHYKVLEKIGEGGMGEVYRATDTKLNRDVALKVLPEQFASDSQRMGRFQREAEVLASLDHPNIGQIYGIEEAGQTKALVLQLIEGPTLADKIAQGPIPVEDALKIALQMAKGLEAAHEKGVIHRDLKPANVKITPEGQVKILDFGLAKALEAEVPESSLSQSPTLTNAATQAGVILGTAAYMSPEQAKGKAVDKRADIFAFGAVLYECLTGKRAFEGEDVSDTLASILAREPDWEALPGATPSIIRSLLRRSVQKDPGDRLRDIGDARLEIKEYLADPTAGGPIEVVQALPAYPGRQRWLPWAGLIAGAIIASIAWNLTRETPPRIARFAIAPSQTAPLAITNNYPDVAISPDGMHIVYVAEDNGRWLYLRPVDQLDPIPIRGAGGGFPGSRSPFFSPDGREIGFVDDTNLKKVSVNGGVSVTLCSVPSLLQGASWGTDGTIIFSTSEGKGLFRVPAAGGDPEIVTTPDAEQGEQSHRWPEILPGGEAVLFAVFTGEGPHIAVLDLETGDYRLLIPGGSHPHYSPTGHIVYGLDGALWATSFDSERLEVAGDAVPILEEVMTKATGAVNFAISKSGSLVYVPNLYGSGLQRTLVWVDREGKEEPLDAEPGSYRQPRISPDGKRVAVEMIEVANNDVWIYDLTRKTLDRLTFDLGVDLSPQWSPDGQRIAFTSLREGVRSVSWKKADGTGAVERLVTSPYPISNLSFSPDQKTLVFVSGGGSSDIHSFSLQDEKTEETLLATTALEESPEISPDGNWIAYMSNESGPFEIYVRPFPNVDDGRWLISTEGGIHPVWSREGHELFYFHQESNEMMVVPVQTEPSFSHGNPRVLFEHEYSLGGIPSRWYDVSPDGQRFLMMKAVAQTEATSTQLIFVENWVEELKRLAPIDN